MPFADIAPYYRGLGWRDRVYARIRYATAPLEAVAALVPAEVETVLELGCSAGVFANVLKALRPSLNIVGVDPDAHKVEVARKTVKGREGINFVVADGESYLAGKYHFDVIVVADMLYLLPPRQQDGVIAKAAAALSAGGYLIIKEMASRPKWKRAWCYFQEWLAVKVARMTSGEGIFLRPAEEYASVMAAAGFAVETFDLHRGYLHPHYALRGRKVV